MSLRSMFMLLMLAGCHLDASAKHRCRNDSDCITGRVCGVQGVCETPTTRMNRIPDATPSQPGFALVPKGTVSVSAHYRLIGGTNNVPSLQHGRTSTNARMSGGLTLEARP